MKKRKIPVIVRLYPDQLYKADLLREAAINRHQISRELREAPARYAFWAAMYSRATKMVTRLEEELEKLEASVYLDYARMHKRVSDIKYHITLDHRVQKLRSSIRKWKNYERDLKYAERTMDKRVFVVQALNANIRKEFDVTTRRTEGRDDD